MRRSHPWHLFVFAGLALWLAGCPEPELPAYSFYDDRVGPILDGSCARQNVGCHVGRPDGTSLGNLDMSSYDSLLRRSDLLTPYGPYSTALLLLKGGEEIEVPVETFDPDNRFVSITTDIRHNAGTNIDLGSSAYAQVKQWIEAGFTRTGVPPEELQENVGECRSGIGHAPGIDPSVAPTDAASFNRFRDEVQPVLQRRCAGGSCHGSTVADLYLSCGDNEEELRWNYLIALSHVTTPGSTSGLLRRPLSTFRGGVFHEGGNVFRDTEDPDYQVIFNWITDIETRAPELVAPPTDIDEGLRFFANRVQPVLVRKGCMFLNCHAPAMFHDLRLRGGSQGHFSRVATMRNYEITRDLMALDSPDPNESRVIAKNLYPPEQVSGSEGIFHRGGSLFEDFGGADGMPNQADPSDCAGVDADNGDLNEIPAYCVLVRWHQIERQAAIARGEIFDDTESVRSVVWVARPTGVGRPDDFDTYRGGADLRMAAAMVDAVTGNLSLGPSSSLLGGCGLDPSTADIRGPSVSWDGERIAFAARTSGSAPLRLYWMNEDGSGCEPIPGVAPGSDEQDGILLHDFDPAFAADGSLVFASTRGYSDPGIVGRAGPTRTPASMAPNANLHVLDPGGEVRQLTFLLNQEMQPSFMADGRVIFTSEKREPEFHQLAGRRQNLDGGDYHPLFAQRQSVGFRSATEIVELMNRNLAFVAAPLEAADGAGTIAVVNRSIGPDQDDRDPGDRSYIGSMRIPFPGAFDGGTGAFRSPSPLPSGRLLVSCDRDASDLTAGGFAFELCELDPADGSLRAIGGEPGRANVEAVAVFARTPRAVFVSRIDEANAHTQVIPGADDAEVIVNDMPLLATLLFANTREGRPIDHRIAGFDVLASSPPPAGARTFGDVGGMTQSDDFGEMFLSRRVLGHVSLESDGSARFRYRGGTPILLRVTDEGGQPLMFPEGSLFTGEMVQREQMQFYPGERSRQSIPRRLFNGLCGGCHGSISGRELDISVDIDVLTTASQVVAAEGGATDLYE